MNHAVGLFGKIPAAGDFVAQGAGTPVAQAFQRWLLQENDALAARQKALPPAPIRFLFRDVHPTAAILGVLAPSRDTVGRSFPLALWTTVELSVAAPQFPYLPAAYALFLDGAATLLQQSHGLDVATLMQRLATLPHPSSDDLTEARAWTYEALDATPGRTILEALFGPLQHGIHFHGFHMFRTACQRVRDHDPGMATAFVECPCADDLQLAFWLVLARNQLRWMHAPPTLFWNDSANPDHRLILALGAPSPGSLQFVADPTARAERLWPTRTTSQASIAAGRDALSPAELRSFDPPAPTASSLLAALAVTDTAP